MLNIKRNLFLIFFASCNGGGLDSLTPLQLVISCKSLLKVISSLVHADTTEHKETVTWESNRNKAKEYQLLAAINNQLPKDVIEILGDAKESGDRITSVNIVPYFCMGDLPNEYEF